MSFQGMCNQLRACMGSASVFPNGTAHIEIGDEKVYALGYTPVAIIDVNPRLRHIREAFGGAHLHEWHIPVTIGAQWRDANNGPTQLNAAWQGVIDQIDRFPHLGLGGTAGIRDAFIESANLQPVEMVYGGVKFANIQLSVVVQEEVVIAEGE